MANEQDEEQRKISTEVDAEKQADRDHDHDSLVHSEQTGTLNLQTGQDGKLSRRLLRYGIETRGIHPIPVEQRTDTQFSKIFFIWFTANFNILSFSAGTLGPVVFGLSLRDSCLVILFFNLLCAIPPSYFTTWGPKLGLRQMVQARYAFGYYGVIVPCIFNLIGMTGFCILNSILGGQTLASVRSSGDLSWSLGIVIIVVISLLLSFCGYKVLNLYERIAWIPVLITFVIALGVGGKHLFNAPAAEPATAQLVLSFASVIAGFVITYSPLASDFTSYMRPDAPSWRIFIYSYLGFLLPIVTLQCLGATFSACALSIPAWEAGYQNGNIGGLLNAVLSPLGGFGKFLVVLLSLSVTGNIAMTFYSISLNIQVFVPVLVVVPRYVFSLLATAVVIPLGIVGSHRFYDTLTNFLSLIGYWASSFISILLIEHLLFRHNSLTPRSYPPTHWNLPHKLPTGLTALGAAVLSFGMVVPCVDQVWFVGPIARRTGDVGFEMAWVVTGVVYVPLRWVERRVWLERSGLKGV